MRALRQRGRREAPGAVGVCRRGAEDGGAVRQRDHRVGIARTGQRVDVGDLVRVQTAAVGAELLLHGYAAGYDQFMIVAVIANDKYGRADAAGLERRRDRAVGMGDHQRGAGHIGDVAAHERDAGQVDAVGQCEAAEGRGGTGRQADRIAQRQSRVQGAVGTDASQGGRTLLLAT